MTALSQTLDYAKQESTKSECGATLFGSVGGFNTVCRVHWCWQTLICHAGILLNEGFFKRAAYVTQLLKLVNTCQSCGNKSRMHHKQPTLTKLLLISTLQHAQSDAAKWTVVAVPNIYENCKMGCDFAIFPSFVNLPDQK